MSGHVHLEIDGAVAVLTNDNPGKHNAFDDDMDLELFAALAELKERSDVKAVLWRGEGPSFSSGRDTSVIGTNKTDLSHHELMRRGHRGIQQLWELDAPVVVACKGWVMGGSFQRALLCDIRVAAQDTRFRLPELQYGVIPDTGGFGTIFQMAGHGVLNDLVLTSRVMSADEALRWGIVSRVVPEDTLDEVARQIADHIAGLPTVSVKMARQIVRRLALPELRSSMTDEMIYQTYINRSDDMAELRVARQEDRPPRFKGS